MTDLTAVEAAARALGEHLWWAAVGGCSCGWGPEPLGAEDEQQQHAAHAAQAAVAAAAPILRAQVLAEAREAVEAELSRLANDPENVDRLASVLQGAYSDAMWDGRLNAIYHAQARAVLALVPAEVADRALAAIDALGAEGAP